MTTTEPELKHCLHQHTWIIIVQHICIVCWLKCVLFFVEQLSLAFNKYIYGFSKNSHNTKFPCLYIKLTAPHSCPFRPLKLVSTIFASPLPHSPAFTIVCVQFHATLGDIPALYCHTTHNPTTITQPFSHLNNVRNITRSRHASFCWTTCPRHWRAHQVTVPQIELFESRGHHHRIGCTLSKISTENAVEPNTIFHAYQLHIQSLSNNNTHRPNATGRNLCRCPDVSELSSRYVYGARAGSPSNLPSSTRALASANLIKC